MSEKRLSSISKHSKPALKSAKKLPARMAVRDIANFKGIAKSEAVLEYVNEQRMKSKLDHFDEKMNTPKSDMPWSPDLKSLIHCPPGAVSVLNREDHRRYVAIISNFLQPTLCFRFVLNRIELEGWDQRLQPEREQYEQCIRSYISQSKFSLFNTVITGAASLFAHRQRGKLLDAFGGLAFRDRIARISWPTVADEEIPSATFRLRCVETLGAGRLERVRFHDVRRRCQYFMNDRVIDEHFTAEAADKTKLVDDPVALEWSLRSGLEYVMDASTLRQLLVDGWAFRNQRFCYRLSVIRRVRDGTTHRVCFFSKPLLASRIDPLHVQRQFMKWTVKAEIRRTAQRASSSAKPRAAPSPAATVRSSTKGNEAMDAKPVKTETSQPSTESIGQTAVVDAGSDLLGGILGSMSAMPSTTGSSSQMKTESSFSFDNLPSSQSTSSTVTAAGGLPPHYQRRYRYETVSLTSTDTGTLLVRTSNHGVDPDGKPVSVTVRNEYIPEAGAQRKCDEELLWNCVTATLKDATEHFNLHMYPRNGHCLQMQRFHAARHFSDMDIVLKRKLWTRIRRVQELLKELDKLDIGEYLIVQNDESLNVLQEYYPSMMPVEPSKREPADDWEMETGEPAPALTVIVNAESLLAACAIDKPLTAVPLGVGPWSGVDWHLPLVWQIVHGRVPGSFLPPDNKLHKMVQNGTLSRDLKKMSKEDKKASGSILSKSQKRRMRRAEKKLNGGGDKPPVNAISPSSFSSTAQPTAMRTTKPDVKSDMGVSTNGVGKSAAIASSVRRFKRPGEKPSGDGGGLPKVSTPAGREKVKYDETPF